jgi:hypothetical protein
MGYYVVTCLASPVLSVTTLIHLGSAGDSSKGISLHP